MTTFFNAKVNLKSMPPKLLSDDKRIIVIRPLAYCREKDLERLSTIKNYPIIPCNLCGSQENYQRQALKAMQADWDKESLGRTENIVKSLQNINLSQLADTQLFDFGILEIDRSTPRKVYEFNIEKVSSTNIDESLVIQIENI